MDDNKGLAAGTEQVEAASELSGIEQGMALLMQGGPVVAILLTLSVITLAIALIKFSQHLVLGVWTDGGVEKALAEADAGRRAEALRHVSGKRHIVARVTAAALAERAAPAGDASLEARLTSFAQS